MKRIITLKLLRDFEKELHESEKSKATIEKYLRDVKRFAEFAEGKKIEKALTLQYKEELGKTHALTGANSMLAAMNALLHFAGLQDCKVRQFKIQKDAFCAEDKELSKTEYISLVRAAEKKDNHRLSLAIQTLCATGIRISELAYVTVEAAKRGVTTVSCKGKTRRIFLVPALCKKLLRYAKERKITSGPIFITRNGNPLNRSNIWTEMKNLCEEAGVSPSKVFPHNLRHLFARAFYAMEKDVVKLADILGHSSINTTRIYTLSTGAEHRKKMENMRLII